MAYVFFSRWEEVPKNFQSCQKSNNSTLTDCCTLCWRNFFSQDATHVLGPKKNAGARRLIWTSRPMLVMSYMLKHCHRWLAGKKEPMMTCSCLVAADPAIWSWGPIIPSSCRIYPHSHTRPNKGDLSGKKQKENTCSICLPRSVWVFSIRSRFRRGFSMPARVSPLFTHWALGGKWSDKWVAITGCFGLAKKDGAGWWVLFGVLYYELWGAEIIIIPSSSLRVEVGNC